jgi:hypothetical protein
MAGYRRTRAAEAAIGAGRATDKQTRRAVREAARNRPVKVPPSRAAKSAAQRRAAVTRRLAEAATPAERVGVAAGYLRGVLKQTGSAPAEAAAARAVLLLLELGNELMGGRR